MSAFESGIFAKYFDGRDVERWGVVPQHNGLDQDFSWHAFIFSALQTFIPRREEVAEVLQDVVLWTMVVTVFISSEENTDIEDLGAYFQPYRAM